MQIKMSDLRHRKKENRLFDMTLCDKILKSLTSKNFLKFYDLSFFWYMPILKNIAFQKVKIIRKAEQATAWKI